MRSKTASSVGISSELTFKMEVKSVDDVEREKRETKEVGEEGGGGGGGGCNRRHVDAAAAAGLRVTGDGGKVSETRR